jgi:hypothetical protein
MFWAFHCFSYCIAITAVIWADMVIGSVIGSQHSKFTEPLKMKVAMFLQNSVSQ